MRCILLLVAFAFATNFASPVVNAKGEFVVGQILDEEKFTLLNKKPAMKMRLTKKGMTYLNGKAADMFNEFVKNFDMTGKRLEMVDTTNTDDKSVNLAGGEVNTEKVFMKITNMTTTSYQPMTFSYVTNGQAITWRGVGGHMIAEGCLEMTMVVDGNENSTTTETGNFTVITKGMEMTATMTMGMKAGKPSLTLETCKFTMATVETSFINNCTGNAMCPKDETMTTFWKDNMATAVCSIMTFAVARINGSMQSFDTLMTVGRSPFQMDYTMLAQPKCADNACEMVHMAEMMFNATTVGALLPLPMPSVLPYEDRKAMMIMQMSDYVLNSMSDVMFATGAMNATMSNDTLFITNPEMAAMLRTECPATELCMGTVTEEMGEKFPNCTVTLRIQAVKPIVFETYPKTGMKMYTQSVITVYQKEEELMRMDVTGRGVITPELVNTTLFMNATMTHMKVTIMKSVFENVDVVQVEKLTELGLLTDKMFTDQMFGEHLAGGLPLPGMDGVAMVPCGIFMEDRSIATCFDMIV